MAHADYHALAAEARNQADAAVLDNVRDRCLRSEAAFRAIAQRQDRVDHNRAVREAATAPATD